jgi:hypothetical protein
LAVSFIQSIYHEFGSGVVLPTTGLNWQNRGASFSLNPHQLQALHPRKRPFHTLNPAAAKFKDGRSMVYGTMGGDGQPQTQAAVFHVRSGSGNRCSKPSLPLVGCLGEPGDRPAIRSNWKAESQMPWLATWSCAVMTLNCSVHTMKQSVTPEPSSDMTMACWKGRRIPALMELLLDTEASALMLNEHLIGPIHYFDGLVSTPTIP